ncbi:cation efflux protein [Coprinellus micaceus]|uniref:Cation efflux protein n=1 Tax=Coprinellus micaceus TaxID=71717 RepID=A0A4Y7T535_COPMI|nr:cation efflux protein [Coprinellus micaceus]
MRVLACGGFGVLLWEVGTRQMVKRKSIEWSALALASFLLFVQYGALFMALYRLPSTRVILFTHFSAYWITSFTRYTSARKAGAILAAISVSVLADTHFFSGNLWRLVPGYGALLLHALSSIAADHTIGTLSPSLGSTFAISAVTLGASLFAVPLYLFRSLMLNFPTTPELPALSWVVIPLVAYSLLFMTPFTTHSFDYTNLTLPVFTVSFPTLAVLSALLGALTFKHLPSWSDFIVAALLYYGMYPDGIESTPPAAQTSTSRLMKVYLKSILSNHESRKIFYFLMLNLAYMLVQLLYGVWTNSLGLISDAIHMAFDCMAIGVGLLASVMATWEPNDRFTYGYGRVETLSGFANGIFLILISIFIVFEAIQRILDPPEMSTNQLLLVSSVGLGVNLFGMFAMGGHHHHGGHSHSHGHSHSLFGGHSDHEHEEDHGHSHSHSLPPSSTHSSCKDDHSHSHEQRDDGHSHSHSGAHPEEHREHSHSSEHHRHSHSRALSHSDNHHDHSHDAHTHSHSPSPPNTEPDVAGHSRSLAQRRQSHGASLSIQINNPVPTAVAVSSSHPNTPAHVHSPDHSSTLDEHSHGHRHSHDHHDHDHDHGHTSHNHSHGHSHNMRGVFLHVMADTLGSVGVIISTLLIQFYGWTGFDPIASLFIAVLIAASVIPLVMDTGRILALDVSEKDGEIQDALDELSTIEGLASYSCPRFWPKDASTVIGSIHIQLAPSAASSDPTGPHSSVRTTYTKIDRVAEKVDTLLRQRISGLEELTVQVEGKGGQNGANAAYGRS